MGIRYTVFNMCLNMMRILYIYIYLIIYIYTMTFPCMYMYRNVLHWTHWTFISAKDRREESMEQKQGATVVVVHATLIGFVCLRL